jgi:hypothetical protein
MRTLLVLLTLCLSVAEVSAQHPLVGTWEMISVRGIGADGEPFFLDTTAVRETKIITPTHYMLIAWDVDNDSLIFNRTMAGEVRLENEKYIEVPLYASVQIFENVDVDFTWKLDGDLFTQSGTIVRPDGKKILLEALIFKRKTEEKANSKNAAVGTWRQVSGEQTAPDGKKNSFSAGDKGLLIVTPTHMMRMNHKGDEFDGVVYASYETKGGGMTIIPHFSSYGTRDKQSRMVLSDKGKKLRMRSDIVSGEGGSAAFEEVFEKVQ